MDALIEVAGEAAPYFAVYVIPLAIAAHIERRKAWRKYVERRRRYSEWRMDKIRRCEM